MERSLKGGITGRGIRTVGSRTLHRVATYFRVRLMAVNRYSPLEAKPCDTKDFQRSRMREEGCEHILGRDISPKSVIPRAKISLGKGLMTGAQLYK